MIGSPERDPERGKMEYRRELETMPFDKMFEVGGNQELCHATGYEVCLGDPADQSDWWNEYVDSTGAYQYGR